MVTKRITLRSQEEALTVFGPHDRNLKNLEQKHGVQIFVRPTAAHEKGAVTLAVRGRGHRVEETLDALEDLRRFHGTSSAGTPPSRGTLVPPIVPGTSGGLDSDVVYTSISGKSIRPQTPHQRTYVQAIRQSDLVVAIGPAGTGKTYLAVACALSALQDGRVSRIVLTRPVVEVGEKLGYLPGDFYEKVHPYLKPLYDAFYVMVGPDYFHTLRDEETIEIVPLAYMRGRTLDEAFIILDEGQNTTPEQIKMFLTRLGTSSQAVITGDITQIDLEEKGESGLVLITEILKDVPGVSFVRLSEEDVVRHGLVKQIIRAYEEWEQKNRPGKFHPL